MSADHVIFDGTLWLCRLITPDQRRAQVTCEYAQLRLHREYDLCETQRKAIHTTPWLHGAPLVGGPIPSAVTSIPA